MTQDWRLRELFSVTISEKSLKQERKNAKLMFLYDGTSSDQNPLFLNIQNNIFQIK